MSARAQRASARQMPEKGLRNSPNALNFGEIALRVSLDELLNLNARCGGSSADLTKESRYAAEQIVSMAKKVQ